jgi:hypothetical protein
MELTTRLISGELIVPHLTKREWFAGMALQGEIARCGVTPVQDKDRQAMVERCFDFADKMVERSGR